MLATVQDLLDRWDKRLVQDLASDDGVPVAEQDLPQHPRILAALAGATGQFRSAVLKGRRYSIEELQQLESDDAAFLKDIICSLAMLRLCAVRGSTLAGDVYQSLQDQTSRLLKSLESGELIFATSSAQQAGLPKTDGPRLVDYQKLNLLVDRCTRYYPERGPSLPAGR